MNQTADQKPKAITKEERALLLLEIVKDLAAIEEEGFGRVVIEVKNGRVVNWWKIASRTRRGFLNKMKSVSGGLTS